MFHLNIFLALAGFLLVEVGFNNRTINVFCVLVILPIDNLLRDFHNLHILLSINEFKNKILK